MVKQVEALVAEDFYTDALRVLDRSEAPFMVGGAFALREYAGIARDTKDLDIFCKPSDYPRLVQSLQEAGYCTEVTDPIWLAKAFCEDYLVDIIFGSANGLCPVDDTWFEHAPQVDLFGIRVSLVPAEEVIWSKSYVQDRHRFDGADVLHILRHQGESLDWKRLLLRMEPHWEVLLAHLVTFRFVYPSERGKVPSWLLSDLLGRVQTQLELPPAKELVCRGPLLSKTQYQIDLEQWGYREK